MSSYAWSSATTHINNLEVTAFIDYLRARSRQAKKHHARFLVLLDSQVALAVLAKGRSSSRSINTLLLRAGALLSACGLLPFFGWTSSETMPADGPSRWKCPRRV